ncbi:MAG: molybdopterin-dependent oxidoreductase, partial [Candidatus Tumulicola sp.]
IDLDRGRAYAEAFAGAAELSTYIASEQGNARGAEAMGMLPRSGPGYAATSAGRDALGMFEDARNGALAVLSVFGANPVRNAVDGAAVAAALAKTPFVAVSELFMTETARLATLILPAKGALEKSGTTVNLAGDVLPVNAALQAPEGVLSDLEMLAGLTDCFDVTLPNADALDAAVIQHAANVPEDFGFGDARFAGSAPVSPPQDTPAPRILSGGGTWQHDPTLAPLRDGAALPQAAGATA